MKSRIAKWMIGGLCMVASAMFAGARAHAQERVTVTQITPNVMVFATSAGNVVASVGPDGALLVGTPSAASTPQIQKILGQRTANARRCVVIFPENAAESQGDAGWGKLGAFVVMQERALNRLGGHQMGKPQPLPARFAGLGVDRPRVSFDTVVSFDMNGEAVHIVKQTPGFCDADAVAHFHVAGVIYMGEVFPGDGYPPVDAAAGGALQGLLDQLAWTDKKFHIVPARGPVTTGPSVKAFADMIVTVRDRVRQMIKEGKSERQVVAARPSAEFDAQYGHGRVSPDAFVREVYEAATAKPPASK